MAATETEICNLALAQIGAKRLDDLDADDSLQATLCNLFFDPIRDALLRSFWWRFASSRVALVEDSSSPDFEWDNQFDLPADFLALKSVYGDNLTKDRNVTSSFALEGLLLLTNADEVDIRYVAKITDVTLFDPLFVQVLALQLAIQLVMPLAQDQVLMDRLDVKLDKLMRKVRAMDRQETNTQGRDDSRTWTDARVGSGLIPSRLGS